MEAIIELQRNISKICDLTSNINLNNKDNKDNKDNMEIEETNETKGLTEIDETNGLTEIDETNGLTEIEEKFKEKFIISNNTGKKKKKYAVNWIMFDIVNNNHITDRINWKDKTIKLYDSKEYIYFKLHYYPTWNIKNNISQDLDYLDVCNVKKIKDLFINTEFKKMFSKQTINKTKIKEDDFIICPLYTKNENIFIALINKNKDYAFYLHDNFLSRKQSENILLFRFLLQVIEGIKTKKFNNNNTEYFTINLFDSLIKECHISNCANINNKLINQKFEIPLCNMFHNMAPYFDNLIIIWINNGNSFNMDLINMNNKYESKIKNETVNMEKRKLIREKGINLNNIKLSNNNFIKKYKIEKYNNYKQNLKFYNSKVYNKNQKKNGNKTNTKIELDTNIKKIFKKYTGCKYQQYMPHKILSFQNNDKKTYEGKNFDDFTGIFPELTL